jgi:RNA polymerase sigma factor (sigma-70 family)
MNNTVMFENNKNLVWEVIKNMHIYATKDMDLEDYYQIGCMGLLKAIDKFDSSKGTAFSTYAYITIKNELKSYFKNSNNSHNKINGETTSYNQQVKGQDDHMEIIDSVVDFSSLDGFNKVGRTTLTEALQTLTEEEYEFFKTRYLVAEFDEEIKKPRDYTIKTLGLKGVNEFKSIDRRVKIKLANAFGVDYDPKKKNEGNYVDKILN